MACQKILPGGALGEQQGRQCQKYGTLQVLLAGA